MTTDDPQRQTAGESPAERAELLGTTALTARVRCPCRKRQDLDRGDWQWFGVALCPACGRGLLDHSLRVVSRSEALAMIEERRPTEGELRALRHIEMALRDFTLRHGEYPRHYWSPQTNRMAGEVGRLLAELDESRKGRGAPPVVASGRAFLDEDDEGGPDETDGDVGVEEWDDDEDDD